MRASLSQRRKDALKHNFRLLQHLIIRKVQHAKPCARQIARPLEVVEHVLRMLSAIELDYESRTQAHKIHDVMFQWHLSPELVAGQLPVAHEPPETAFGVA